MAKYPLQALLDVRLFREETAKQAVSLAERKLAEAKQETEKRRNALETYRAWWPTEVDRRYDAIIQGKQGMTLDELDTFRSGLAALANEELNYHAACLEAEKIEKQRQSDLAKAKTAVIQARRDAAKIETHRSIWLEQEKKEAERLEDLELEEFHAPKPIAINED